jgi:hypothetical protein
MKKWKLPNIGKDQCCVILSIFKQSMVSIFNLFKNQRTIDSNSLKKKSKSKMYYFKNLKELMGSWKNQPKNFDWVFDFFIFFWNPW